MARKKLLIGRKGGLLEVKTITNGPTNGTVWVHESGGRIELAQRPDGGGIRHNAGKLRLDLVPADVIAALAEVLGHACTQRNPPYPERNWERGMKWSDVVASLERHLLDVKMGRRLDPSGTGLRSTALLLCNAAFLCGYDIRGMHHLDDLEPFARAKKDPDPVPMVLHCPRGHRHVDRGTWASTPHKTHRCTRPSCGLEWRPASVSTVGVVKLP
jgi:hypothetical protein